MSSFSSLSSRRCLSPSESCLAHCVGPELDCILRRLGFLVEYADMAARPGEGVAYLDGFAAVLGDVLADASELRDKVSAVVDKEARHG